MTAMLTDATLRRSMASARERCAVASSFSGWISSSCSMAVLPHSTACAVAAGNNRPAQQSRTVAKRQATGSGDAVGQLGLALGDERLQRLVDAGIDRRRFVTRQRLLCLVGRPRVQIAAALGLPLLEAVVVGELRGIEG